MMQAKATVPTGTLSFYSQSVSLSVCRAISKLRGTELGILSYCDESECVQAPLPDLDDALQTQQTALRHSLVEPSDHSQTSAGSISSSKKHKPGNWAGEWLLNTAAESQNHACQYVCCTDYAGKVMCQDRAQCLSSAAAGMPTLAAIADTRSYALHTGSI